MFGGTGSVESYIGYVVTVQGMNAVVYVVGLVFVAVEAGYAEIGVSARSIRKPSLIAFTADLVAQ